MPRLARAKHVQAHPRHTARLVQTCASFDRAQTGGVEPTAFSGSVCLETSSAGPPTWTIPPEVSDDSLHKVDLAKKLTLQSHIVLDVSQGQLVLSLAVVRASNNQL
jgi:hypothetical protein